MKLVSQDPSLEAYKQRQFEAPSARLLKEMECDEYWFPLRMSEFKEWYMEQEGLDEGEDQNP